MYQLDLIEINMLVDVHDVLKTLGEFFESGEVMHPYALLFDDTETVTTHVKDAQAKIAAIVNRARGAQ